MMMSIGELERLAGIGQSKEERTAFWMRFAHLKDGAFNAAIAELRRRAAQRALTTAANDMMERTMRFEVTVIDLAEGTMRFEVEATDEEAAYEEATIAAAERGCQHVSEIIVGSFE